MADNDENVPSVYRIPDNFIGESRVFGGRIRVRYLIDSIALSLILGLCVTLPLILFVLKGVRANILITVAVMTIAPGFLIGQLGYNGDPISVFLVNYFNWRKQRQVRLYNETPRLLGTDPVKAVTVEGRGMDKLVTFIQERQQKKIDKKNSESYIEGETFEFAYDPGIDGYTEDNGDYDDDEYDAQGRIPVSNVSIASGDDLRGLVSILSADGYNEPIDAENDSYGSYSLPEMFQEPEEGDEDG